MTEQLPEDLQSIVRAQYCPRPPAMLESWDAHGLTQLAVVVEALHHGRATLDQNRRKERHHVAELSA